MNLLRIGKELSIFKKINGSVFQSFKLLAIFEHKLRHFVFTLTE